MNGLIGEKYKTRNQLNVSSENSRRERRKKKEGRMNQGKGDLNKGRDKLRSP